MGGTALRGPDDGGGGGGGAVTRRVRGARRVGGGIAGAALAALYLLHNDVWFWGAPHRLTVLWGLPAGFVYHVAFCFAAAGVMALLARRVWPPAA